MNLHQLKKIDRRGATDRGGADRSGIVIALASLTLLAGCGTVTATVPDATGVEHVSALSMSCSKPYALTQDCSGFSGAKRLVDISGFRYKIAGSADGSVVLMMGAKPNSDAFAGKSTETANVAYEVTKKFLLDQGINITLTQPVTSGSYLAGYIVKTDGDAYAALSGQTVGS